MSVASGGRATPPEPSASRSGVSLPSLVLRIGRLTFWLVRRRGASQDDGQNRSDTPEDGAEDRNVLCHDVHASSMAL